MSARIIIRPFVEEDTPQVRDLFISVNRQLASPNLYEVFEGYITRALVDEIDRITAYYRDREAPKADERSLPGLSPRNVLYHAENA